MRKTKTGTKNRATNRKTVANMLDIYPIISLITLNVNGLNAPI